MSDRSLTADQQAQSRVLFTQLVETLNASIQRHHLETVVIVQGCGYFIAQVFAHQSFPTEVPRSERDKWLAYFLETVGAQVRDLWKPYDT